MKNIHILIENFRQKKGLNKTHIGRLLHIIIIQPRKSCRLASTLLPLAMLSNTVKTKLKKMNRKTLGFLLYDYGKI